VAKRLKIIDPAALATIFSAGDVIEVEDDEVAQGYIDQGAAEETTDEVSAEPSKPEEVAVEVPVEAEVAVETEVQPAPEPEAPEPAVE
jgi:hypothetical protein